MKTTKKDEIRMMSDPMSWPNLILPIKRYVDKDGKKLSSMESGFLTGERNPIRLYHENMWALNGMTPEQRKAIPTTEYASFEALVDDGWVVD